DQTRNSDDRRRACGELLTEYCRLVIERRGGWGELVDRGTLMAKIIAAVAAAGVATGVPLLAPTEGATPQATPSYQPPPVEWGECEDERLAEAGAECGFVEVPLNYAKPDGKKIK